MKITEELLQKYNVPVPRYTSYPPANQFSAEFGREDYLIMLRDSNNGTPGNIAIYVHIPFCRKICFYCGCNACLMGNVNLVRSYLDALKKEIMIVSGHIDKRRRVSQIHFGGGTPNAIDAASLKSINDLIFSEFSLIKDPEIAVELNPAYLDRDYINELLDAGFNRFSFGIQDFNEDVLRKVNRQPSAIPPAELAEYVKSRNAKTGVNFDFIYGLPGQTVTSFSSTISRAVEIRPHRLVTFSYAHVPWVKKHQLVLEKMGLPSVHEKTNMFLAAGEILKDAGYKAIGLDHFVLPSDDLFLSLNEGTLHRNFQGYCTRRTTGQVYAFGVTGISQLDGGYSQNKKEIADYIADINSGMLPVERGLMLDRSQKITREVINEIMCNKRLNLSSVAEANSLSLSQLGAIIRIDESSIKDLTGDGLIETDGDNLIVTEKGSFFIRNIAASLDKSYTGEILTYSKNV